MNRKYITLFVFLPFVFLNSNAQLILSAPSEKPIIPPEEGVIEFKERNPTGDIHMTITNELGTANGLDSEFSTIDLSIERNGTKVDLLLETIGELNIEQLNIERKIANSTEQFRPIKIISNEQLTQLNEKGYLLLSDEYPDGWQNEVYYRANYLLKNSSNVIKPAIHLTTESTLNRDPSTLAWNNELSSIGLQVMRNNNKVELTLFTGKGKFEYSSIAVERKVENESKFKPIKYLIANEMELLEQGEVLVEDKYPPNVKLRAEYRLKVTDLLGHVFRFDKVVLMPSTK